MLSLDISLVHIQINSWQYYANVKTLLYLIITSDMIKKSIVKWGLIFTAFIFTVKISGC